MSRPIFEPSLERADAALGYDKNQLQRRPSPTPAAEQTLTGVAIDWCYSMFVQTPARDTTVTIDFTTSGTEDEGGGGYVDVSGANGRPRVLQSGFYLYTVQIEANDTSVPFQMPTFFRLKFLGGVPAFPGMIWPIEAGAGGNGRAFDTVMAPDLDDAGDCWFMWRGTSYALFPTDPPSPVELWGEMFYQGAEDVTVRGSMHMLRLRDASMYSAGVVVGALDYQLS